MGGPRPDEDVPGQRHRLAEGHRVPLVAPGSDDYIGTMAVLESSANELTLAEIAVQFSATGPAMSDMVVQKRLYKLKDLTAAPAVSRLPGSGVTPIS